jgi:hypothetical protein
MGKVPWRRVADGGEESWNGAIAAGVALRSRIERAPKI